MKINVFIHFYIVRIFSSSFDVLRIVCSGFTMGGEKTCLKGREKSLKTFTLFRTFIDCLPLSQLSNLFRLIQNHEHLHQRLEMHGILYD